MSVIRGAFDVQVEFVVASRGLLTFGLSRFFSGGCSANRLMADKGRGTNAKASWRRGAGRAARLLYITNVNPDARPQRRIRLDLRDAKE